MVWFLGLGIGGLVLLVLCLVFDGVLEGALDGLGGGLDGFLSLPVIAGFVSALGFAGAITMGVTGTGAGVSTGAGAIAGGVVAWLTGARLTGEGEKAQRAALAEAVWIEGEAEAAAIGAKGSAEAEAMRKKADAFAQYGDAAVLQMLVEVLPQVVAKAAEPLAAVDKMTVISTDGANRLTRTVTDNVAQGMELLAATTGVDLAALLQGITNKAEPAAVPAATSAQVEITD